MEGINEVVKEYILNEFLPGADPSELTDTTPLIRGNIIDSLAMLKLVAFLEERFGITIQPHEASVDYMDTTKAISELVQSKK
jgi:acyl carrier protein